MSFGKISTLYQDIWEISANENNIFGLFTAHSFSNSTFFFYKRSSLSVTKAITFATLATKHEIAIMNKLIENNLV